MENKLINVMDKDIPSGIQKVAQAALSFVVEPQNIDDIQAIINKLDTYIGEPGTGELYEEIRMLETGITDALGCEGHLLKSEMPGVYVIYVGAVLDREVFVEVKLVDGAVKVIATGLMNGEESVLLESDIVLSDEDFVNLSSRGKFTSAHLMNPLKHSEADFAANIALFDALSGPQ